MTSKEPQADRAQNGPPAYQDHFYASSDDRLTLYARIYDGPEYEDNRPPLLLMHGLTRNSGDFEGLAAHLAAKYRLIIPDQRGRGRSDHDPDPENYTPEVYVADMAALISGLQLDRPGLIGTSMGGLMAIIMAASAPENFSSIILNDIGPVVEQAGLDRIQGYIGEREPFDDWQDAAEQARKVHSEVMAGYDAQDWMDFARHTCREMADGRVKFDYDPAIAQGLSGSDQTVVPPDLWPLWDRLSALPVLIVYGALSDIISANTITEMQQRHSGPIGAVEVPGRGHAPMLDEPAALSAIDAFLKKST